MKKRNQIICIIISLIMSTVVCNPALSQTSLESTFGDGGDSVILVPDDYPTIQEGIDAAVNGDTVLVSPGTYVENIDFLGKAITVISSNGPEVTIIDGGNPVNPDYGSVVIFSKGEGLDSVLDGFTVTNGNGTLYHIDDYDPACGGGIFCVNASPTIKNNIITNNNIEYGTGGGIFCNNSSIIIDNNIIQGNYAPSGGGGIECKYGSPTITDNSILCQSN